MSEFPLPVLDSNESVAASTNTLVFIDAAVDGYPTFFTKMTEKVDAIVLNPIEDGVVQITTTLARYRNLDKLHIVSLGFPEGIYLGNGILSLDTLHGYVHRLMAWTDSLKPNAAIFLYGCQGTNGDLGMELVTKLSHLTRVSVAVA